MKLILTEKPSQARDIAKAFKNCKNRDGYIECTGGWFITWAFGHLFEIDTEKIFPFGRILEFPEKFEYRLISRSHAKQFKVIKNLLSKADEVYIFSDPEREGELLARLILYQAGWKRWDKTYRFWSSKALTPDVVWEEIRAKRPAKNFDSVYYEALARQHSDWLVGIPLSRVIMSKVRNAEGFSTGSWSVGRVQTPALRLIVEREIERENFIPQDYYVIKAEFQKNSGEKYEGVLVLKEKIKTQNIKNDENEEEDEINKKENVEGSGVSPEKAKKVLAELRKEKTGVVVNIEKSLKRELPPLLYSLTNLQRDASKIFGFSAQKTLNVAQYLYEKHLISYPRTESRHLSEKDKNLVISVLRKLGRSDLISAVSKVRKRVFDDSKLTDHFALIPLDKPKTDLYDDERKIYDLILKRFLAVFYPAFVYEEVKVITKVGEFSFLSKGRIINQKGWTELYGERESRLLPPLVRGERVDVEKITSEKKQTKPPARYTDGILISRMKRLGIGTPATRAMIIESLIKRGYIMRRKKELIPSFKGRELIKNLKNKSIPLVNVEMTAEWENVLKKIREKKLGFKGYSAFVEKIKRFVIENAKILESIEIDVNKIKSDQNQRVFRKRKSAKSKSRHFKRKK